MKNPIPMTVWDQHVAILAKTGRGKTITAKGGATALMRARLRCGVVDPTAAWWGMRLKADGKTAGFPMVIFGGDHADIPLDITRHNADAIGRKIAALVAGADWSWVLDISKLGADVRAYFMTGFAETLFAENRRRLNLFLDECHLYMPQQKLPTKASAHMTAACNNLVSGGRSRGLNITMISQRSAKVHKDSLTQAETLITLGMIAPHDIAAVEAWVKVQGDMKAAGAMLKSLPALPVGTGWVYAPELGMLEKVKFPMIDTFDSSRAPGTGEDLRAPSELAQINLDEIRAALSPKPAMIQKPSSPKVVFASLDVAQKKTDAAALKDREAAFAAGRKEGAATILRDVVPGMLDFQHRASLLVGYAMAQAEIREALKDLANPPVEKMPDRAPLKEIQALSRANVPQGTLRDVPPKAGEHLAATSFKMPSGAYFGKDPVKPAGGAGGLDGPVQRIVDSIRWWNLLGVQAPSQVQAGFMARYSHKSGTWSTHLGRARGLGMVEGKGDLVLTAAGLAAANDPDKVPTGAEVRETVLAALPGPQQRILAPLLESYPGSLTQAEAAAAAGYSHVSGTWSTHLGKARGLDLVSGRGDLRAQDWLFPEGK